MEFTGQHHRIAKDTAYHGDMTSDIQYVKRQGGIITSIQNELSAQINEEVSD